MVIQRLNNEAFASLLLQLLNKAVIKWSIKIQRYLNLFYVITMRIYHDFNKPIIKKNATRLSVVINKPWLFCTLSD